MFRSIIDTTDGEDSRLILEKVTKGHMKIKFMLCTLINTQVQSDYVQSTDESGRFQRYGSDLYKTASRGTLGCKAASRTSLGVTNSVSHSSYNSANEVKLWHGRLHQLPQELQFDLYDYDTHGMAGQPATVGTVLRLTPPTSQFDFADSPRAGGLWDAFSLSDFVPIALFPEDEEKLVSSRWILMFRQLKLRLRPN